MKEIELTSPTGRTVAHLIVQDNGKVIFRVRRDQNVIVTSEVDWEHS